MGLEGRAAVVTGAGRGIGRAMVLDLARAGAAVGLVARTASEIESAASAVRAAGGRAIAHPADVADAAELRAALQAIAAALGAVDILVNAAGIAPTAPLVKTSDEMWRRTLAVNLDGVFFATREVLPGMMERGFGRVINVASIAGKTGTPYIAAYAASKHAVLGFTKVAALEAAARGVTVNAICPGYVDTPMTDAGIARIVEKTGVSASEARRRLEEMSPQKRMVTAGEVSALAVYLCGDAARGITGQALSVDGGTVV